MKHQKYKLQVSALLILSFCLFLSAQETAKDPAIDKDVSREDPGPASKGIHAELAIIENKDHRLPEIEVRVVNTNEYGFFGEKLPDNPRDVSPILSKIFSDQLLYFRTTNVLSGPLKLQDPAGKEVPPTNANLVQIVFPTSFSFSDAKKHNPHPPSLFPRPLVHSPELLDRFPLSDYYNVKEPGEYRLTVRPKIYRRPTTNDDICERIDLDPVTTIIKIDSVP